MTHEEICFCKKKALSFTSAFGVDVVTQLYCPDCVDRASEDTVVFEMCEPNDFHGLWGVRYNSAELKHIDEGFRDADDYYLSLLISGTVGPTIARKYGEAGLCRILGFHYSPDRVSIESSLAGPGQAIADAGKATDWPGDVVAGPKEVKKGKPGK